MKTGTILWAGNDSAHYDHLHIEGPVKGTGTPPTSNPGMTSGLTIIYNALVLRYGPIPYFQSVSAKTADVTHMGIWNRRHIGNDPNKPWSQHAYANAIDIGPFYGVAQQQRIYNFLKGVEDELAILTDAEQKQLQLFLKELKGVGSDPTFVRYLIPWFRLWRALKPADVQGASLPKEETVVIKRG